MKVTETICININAFFLFHMDILSDILCFEIYAI